MKNMYILKRSWDINLSQIRGVKVMRYPMVKCMQWLPPRNKEKNGGI